MFDQFISRISLKAKILLIISVLIFQFLLISAVALTLQGIKLYDFIAIRNQGARDRLQHTFEHLKNETFVDASMIADNTNVRRGTYFNNTSMVLKYIQPLLKEIKLDLIVVHNDRMVVVAQAPQIGQFNIAEPANQAVREALAGRTTFSIESYQNRPVFKTTSPVYHETEQNRIVGATTAGFFVDDHFAVVFKDLCQEHVIIFRDRESLADSFPKRDLPIIRLDPADPAPDLTIGGITYDLQYIPISTTEFKELGIAIALDNSPIRTALFWTIAFISILTLLSTGVTLLFSFKIEKNVIRSLDTILKSSQAIASDNYDIHIELNTRDEFKTLAESFNKMARNVKESFGRVTAQHNEIRMLQSYLSNIIESMPSMLISVNRDGIITQWNSAAARLTGLPTPAALGKNLWEILPEFEKYRPYVEETKRTTNSKTLLRESFRAGGAKFFNVSIFPLLANCEEGAVFRLDDITEIEQKEEQLRQAQKMETVGTLAGGLAHDFNNVLGGILGTSSLLTYKLGRDPEMDRNQVLRHLATIEESANRAADIVKQLLVISKKQEVTYAPADLNFTVKHVLKVCQNTFDRSVEIRPVFCQTSAMIHADFVQMEQVLLNLCVNGYHAMTIMRGAGEKQGGRLTVSIESILADRHFCATHPEAEEGHRYWILSVRDSGVGMETKTVAKIFDPFYTTKTKGRGTGLGLAMVYNIVQQHHGFIDVYSEVNIGSTFNVYLPVYEGQGAPRGEQAATVDIVPGEGLILVVDDDNSVRQVARAILEECGYTVIVAGDGEEGVHLFQQRHAEIKGVLLDLIMPKKSGKEAFLEMKQINPRVKVLLTSGFRQDERVDDVLAQGVRGFVQKPYTLWKLSAAMGECLAGGGTESSPTASQ